VSLRALGLAALLAVSTPGVGSAAFRVGFTTLALTKTSVTTGAPRTLETVVWYPTTARSRRAAPAAGNAPLRRGRYPLVVFSHGACGRPTEATYLTMALASRGFVVVAPSHPGDTADDGFASCASRATTIDSAVNRVPDVQFAIDAMLAAAADPSSRFARHLRTDAIGMSGLSFGGFTTLLAAQEEPRIRAALAMVPGGTAALLQGAAHDVTIPTMVIGAEHDVVVGYAESEMAFVRLAGPRFLVKVLAANHLSLVDDCFNHDLNVSFCVPTDISQDDAHRRVLHYAIPFLRRYVANARGGGRVLERPIDGVEVTAEPGR
jgi:predicted dienelactone hydrolase